MCDYSLQGLPNRLAREGELLVTFRFPTNSIGMASPRDIAAVRRTRLRGRDPRWWSALKCWINQQPALEMVPAVCIPPGARLGLNYIPANLRERYAVRKAEVVTFVQVSARAYRYRDAIRFGNGCEVLLQAFAEGVLFEVLSLEVCETKPEAGIPVLTREVA